MEIETMLLEQEMRENAIAIIRLAAKIKQLESAEIAHECLSGVIDYLTEKQEQL